MQNKLATLVVGPFAVNCYLYWNPQTNQGVVIDPGDQAEEIMAAIDEAGFAPQAILLTHGHGDHIAGVAEVKQHFNIPLYISDKDREMLGNPSANVSAAVGYPIVAPEPDHLLVDETMVTLGGISLRILATPGHTRGGVCFLDEAAGLLFCGDTLFAGSIGRTDLPGGSLDVLLASIDAKILKLPDSVICLSGHGPQTTVGAERTSNPFLQGGHFA